MSVDDPPEEGFVRGASFLHPTMRLGFAALPDFRLFNAHDGVLGVGRDRSLLYFSCKRRGRARARLDDGCATAEADPDQHPGDGDRRRGGGDRLPAARVRHRPGADAVRSDPPRAGVCYFNLLSDGPDRDRRIEAMDTAARSFQT